MEHACGAMGSIYSRVPNYNLFEFIYYKLLILFKKICVNIVTFKLFLKKLLINFTNKTSRDKKKCYFAYFFNKTSNRSYGRRVKWIIIWNGECIKKAIDPSSLAPVIIKEQCGGARSLHINARDDMIKLWQGYWRYVRAITTRPKSGYGRISLN